MKEKLRLIWLGCVAALAVPLLHADNIPDLFLHHGLSLKSEWKSIIDPYESGFYDYRREPRDLNRDYYKKQAATPHAKLQKNYERISN